MSSKSDTEKSYAGILPEGWEVRKIDQLANVRTGPFGSLLHQDDYVHDGTPIITVEHLGDRGIIHKNLPMVSDKDKQRLNAYLLQKHDIVFSRVGSVDRNAIVKEDEEGWLFSGRLLRIRAVTNDVYPPFLSYFFSSEPFKKRIRSVAVGQTMASLNTKIMNNIEVVLPSPTEQRAIAEVLSDVDALIEAQEGLIEKKRLIKQGVMQELLTGKRRLPGFSGEWEVVKIDEIAEVLKGKGLSKSEMSSTGKNKAILYGELFTTYDEVIDQVYSSTDSDQGVLSEFGDVLMPGSTTTDGIDLCKASALLLEQILLGGDVNIIRSKSRDRFSPEFLAYYISHMKKDDIQKAAQGITIIHLYGKDIKEIPVNLPPLNEQIEIVHVIKDIDKELKLLEEKEKKSLLIKQGMMQELLTGRTRLV